MIDSLIITWPSGKKQILKNQPVNKRLTLDEKSAQSQQQVAADIHPIFINDAVKYNISYKHKENDYNDYNDESLLPRLYSRKGPGIAVGDVDHKNGDDFFIGAATGDTGTLFLQNAAGGFDKKKINMQDAKYEDMGCLLFDADNDGDVDLYVVSGGNEFKQVPGAYQDRLYMNDGKGNFSKNESLLPETNSSGSCVIGADFDKDGDIDLFRAGANQPGQYPQSPRSYLLQNNGGKFTDVTKEIAPALANIGMINSAVWSDFDNDGWIDLIVAGEWMQPSFFKNEKGKLVDVTKQTLPAGNRGWWNSIYPVDIDNDGDMDYVLGNMGTNVDYRPLPSQPVELFYSNFAGIAKAQPVLSCYMADENGNRKRYPFAYRDDLFRVMPSLKKKYWNYDLYSRATLDDIFTTDALTNATHYQADMFENCILKNEGKGKFSIKALPPEAQLSCVNGVMATDINADGNMDLVLTGNLHSSEIVYGWMDASPGLLLLGDGKGNFAPVSSPQSGLFLYGDMKSLAAIYNKNGQQVMLAAANADSLKVLTQHNPLVKIFYANPSDVFAEIIYKDGRKTKHEFNYGAGYLSQSARAIAVNSLVQSIVVTDAAGNKRNILF